LADQRGRVTPRQALVQNILSRARAMASQFERAAGKKPPFRAGIDAEKLLDLDAQNRHCPHP